MKEQYAQLERQISALVRTQDEAMVRCEALTADINLLQESLSAEQTRAEPAEAKLRREEKK